MARVPYLGSDSAAGEVAELLAELERRGVHQRILMAVANSPGAVRNFARLGNSLIRYTKLDPRLRELVVLRLSVVLDAPYEWYEHEPIARDVGVGDDELRALRSPTLDGPLDERDRAVLAFATKVVARQVTDADWEAVAAHLDTEEATDLVLAASWWGAMVPATVAALGVEAPEHAPPGP